MSFKTHSTSSEFRRLFCTSQKLVSHAYKSHASQYPCEMLRYLPPVVPFWHKPRHYCTHDKPEQRKQCHWSCWSTHIAAGVRSRMYIPILIPKADGQRISPTRTSYAGKWNGWIPAVPACPSSTSGRCACREISFNDSVELACIMNAAKFCLILLITHPPCCSCPMYSIVLLPRSLWRGKGAATFAPMLVSCKGWLQALLLTWCRR